MRRLSHLTALLLSTGALACGSGHDATSPTAPGITGTWTLQTVNGAPLPFTIRSNDTVTEVLAASYDLKATSASGGSFAYMASDRITVGDSVVVTMPPRFPVSGTFTLNDTTAANDTIVSLKANGFAGIAVDRALWSGNTLTLRYTVPIEEGQVWVHARK